VACAEVDPSRQISSMRAFIRAHPPRSFTQSYFALKFMWAALRHIEARVERVEAELARRDTLDRRAKLQIIGGGKP
jgi:hypothetical protein